MKIDKEVEPAVREAFAASAGGEAERFDTALEALADRGQAFLSAAVSLGYSIGVLALASIHQGRRPVEVQLDTLAAELVEDAQDWAPDVQVRDARIYLTSLADGGVPDLEGGDLATLVFGGGGWLLSAFVPDDLEWTNFLDVILSALEAPE